MRFIFSSSPVAQDPFDLFSWQAFIALNWPADDTGKPQKSAIGEARDAPRIWNHYATPAQLFGVAGDDVCAAERADRSQLVVDQFLQPGGRPLIDRDGNYVVYDTRVNSVLAGYLRDNRLDSVAGQIAFAESGAAVDFPVGYYADINARIGGSPGALAIKTAWRIMPPEALPATDNEAARYHITDGFIAVAAEDSADGNARCIAAKLGLVGMHIVQRTQSGNGDDWIWTTFEHADNAPFAANARGANSILANPLFPGGCHAPGATDARYSFYRNDRAERPTNAVAGQRWRWATAAPFAVDVSDDGAGNAQVVRCWKPSAGTDAINQIWRQKLAGTVWANYQLSTTQWKGANEDALFPNGEVPRFLTNSAIETYLQTDHAGTCLGCHSTATDTTGNPSNFSFILRRAAD